MLLLNHHPVWPSNPSSNPSYFLIVKPVEHFRLKSGIDRPEIRLWRIFAEATVGEVSKEISLVTSFLKDHLHVEVSHSFDLTLAV